MKKKLKSFETERIEGRSISVATVEVKSNYILRLNFKFLLYRVKIMSALRRPVIYCYLVKQSLL